MPSPRIICLIFFIASVRCDISDNSVEECALPQDLIDEIAGYAPIVQKIVKTAVNGSFTGKVYEELSRLVDKYGNRISGSDSLEKAIDHMLELSKTMDLDNVHGEEVLVPHWVRGSESAHLVAPRNQSFYILGLGTSIGTGPDGILAEVLVVKSFEELEQRKNEVPGKIVVFNQDWKGYGVSVKYRGQGATAASKVGAVAALVRSVTDFSLNTPHTGMQSYAANVTKIPVACLTVEDANLLQRLQDAGETIKILLKMQAQNLPEAVSRNTVFELKGHEKPEQVVVVSGHLDSWDVGQGALDDGGGALISWGALALLKALGLVPKRTLRGILWTAEEFGYVGAFGYKAAHANDSDFVLFMESDIGTFEPLGVQYTADPQGGCIIQEIVKLLAPINATRARKSESVGSDIEIWLDDGYPGISLDTKNERYFWYHHTPADTMDAESTENLDKNTALWASVAYIIADLSIDFPKAGDVVKC